jgi:predicted Zn-dependent protease
MRLLLSCLGLLLLAPILIAATPAEAAWQKGQQAMDRDRIEDAIGHFQVALRLDAKFAQAHLSLAAAYLALGHDNKALPHMARYLKARPHHFLVRLHYGELLHRQDRLEEAWQHIDRVVREVQEHPRLADDHLLACHTRLMELAVDLGDEYNEHLHRGIGLFLLARKRAEPGDTASRRAAEELLCKAAAELILARQRRPGDGRACWYLHGVWKQLAQRQPAMRWLRAAEQAAPYSKMTHIEKRDLELACTVLRLETTRK